MPVWRRSSLGTVSTSFPVTPVSSKYRPRYYSKPITLLLNFMIYTPRTLLGRKGSTVYNLLLLASLGLILWVSVPYLASFAKLFHGPSRNSLLGGRPVIDKAEDTCGARDSAGNCLDQPGMGVVRRERHPNGHGHSEASQQLQNDENDLFLLSNEAAKHGVIPAMNNNNFFTNPHIVTSNNININGIHGNDNPIGGHIKNNYVDQNGDVVNEDHKIDSEELTADNLDDDIFTQLKHHQEEKAKFREKIPLIFVGGMPRSGTTLMRAILDAHPEVKCGEETRVIPRVLFMRKNWSNSQIEAKRLQEAHMTNEVIDAAIGDFILTLLSERGKGELPVVDDTNGIDSHGKHQHDNEEDVEIGPNHDGPPFESDNDRDSDSIMDENEHAAGEDNMQSVKAEPGERYNHDFESQYKMNTSISRNIRSRHSLNPIASLEKMPQSITLLKNDDIAGNGNINGGNPLNLVNVSAVAPTSFDQQPPQQPNYAKRRKRAAILPSDRMIEEGTNKADKSNNTLKNLQNSLLGNENDQGQRIADNNMPDKPKLTGQANYDTKNNHKHNIDHQYNYDVESEIEDDNSTAPMKVTKKRLCNKDPFVMKSADLVFRIFPRAKFVFMIRDGRAVVSSVVTRKVTITGWDINDYKQCLTMWNNGVSQMYNICQTLGPQVCMPVHYEKLVLQPRSTIRNILRFLDLPWTPRVLRHSELIGKPDGISISKLERSSDQVIKPINTEALEKWRKTFPKDLDVANIAPMLLTLNYSLTNETPNYGTVDPMVLENDNKIHSNQDYYQERIKELNIGPLQS